MEYILARKKNCRRWAFSYFCHERSSLHHKNLPSCRRAALLRPHPQKQSACRTLPSSPGDAKKYNRSQSQRSVVWFVFIWFYIFKRQLSHKPGIEFAFPTWPTWKEWTGSCLMWFLTGVALVGVCSGVGALGCTARLWFVTASCNAFSTFNEERTAVFQSN